MREKTVLVTGATGFVGRHLSERLKSAGARVIASGRNSVDGPWDEFLEWDLSSENPVPSLAGVDTIYHLASKAHALSEKLGDTTGYHDVIVGGTRKLVTQAERDGVKSLVYMSSVKAMGEGSSKGQCLSEVFAGSPKTPYGKAELEAERLVLDSVIPHAVVLRPVMVYGLGHKGNLVKMAEAIRKNRFPPVQDYGNRRTMLHVDDLIEACLAAEEPKANEQVFIVAGNRHLSTRQLFDTLREEMSLRPVQWSVPDLVMLIAAKSGDLLGRLLGRRMPFDSETAMKLVGSACYDNAKSRRILGLDYANSDRPFLEEQEHIKHSTAKEEERL